MGAHRETPAPNNLTALLPRRTYKRGDPALPAPRAAIPLLPPPRHPLHPRFPPPHPAAHKPQPVQAPHTIASVVDGRSAVLPAPHAAQHRAAG
jgi:hypothetical protein